MRWRDWVVVVVAGLAYPVGFVLLWAAFETMFGK